MYVFQLRYLLFISLLMHVNKNRMNRKKVTGKEEITLNRSSNVLQHTQSFSL